MFVKLIALLMGEGEAASVRDDLELAVAALLVEAACMDSHFDDSERQAIKRILAARFDLSDAAAEELLTAAMAVTENSVQIFGFTRGMAQRLSYEERVQIIELLWEVVYADGILTAEEDSLIRRVAGLIYVSDADRAGARRKVLRANGLAS